MYFMIILSNSLASPPSSRVKRAAISYSVRIQLSFLGVTGLVPRKEMILVRTSSWESRCRHCLMMGREGVCGFGKFSRKVIQQASTRYIFPFSLLNCSTSWSTLPASSSATPIAARTHSKTATTVFIYKTQYQDVTGTCGSMQGGVQSKKEEFKKYLEKTGAVDQLTKILVQLYEEPEKPGNAVDYLKRMLGGGGEVDGGKLKKEYEAAKEENERLKKDIREIKEKIEKKKNL